MTANDDELEQQRGNARFNENLNLPISLTHTEEITAGDGLLRAARKCGNRVIANRVGYLACFEAHSRELLWSLESPGLRCQLSGYGDELYALGSREWLAQFDPETGRDIWRTCLDGDIEAIKQVTSSVLFTVQRTDDNHILHARSKDEGHLLWSCEKDESGNFSTVLSERGIIVVETSLGCRAFDEESGEQLWAFKFDAWLQKYIPHLDTSQTVMLHLLVDGQFYLGINGGYVAALDATTGQTRWIYEVELPASFSDRIALRNPMTLIQRNDELLFTINQGRGDRNYLTILNAEDGSQVYLGDANITPRGCFNPVIVGQNFIGASGSHLSVFDIDRKEYIWNYEVPKKQPIFLAPIVPLENGLVTFNNQTNSLYWFESSDK